MLLILFGSGNNTHLTNSISKLVKLPYFCTISVYYLEGLFYSYQNENFVARVSKLENHN